MAVGRDLRGIPEGKGKKGALGLAEKQPEDPRAVDLRAWQKCCVCWNPCQLLTLAPEVAHDSTTTERRSGGSGQPAPPVSWPFP